MALILILDLNEMNLVPVPNLVNLGIKLILIDLVVAQNLAQRLVNLDLAHLDPNLVIIIPNPNDRVPIALAPLIVSNDRVPIALAPLIVSNDRVPIALAPLIVPIILVLINVDLAPLIVPIILVPINIDLDLALIPLIDINHALNLNIIETIKMSLEGDQLQKVILFYISAN